ncbi:MAG: hypothetical protein V4726_02015 [Verrucomicrobiota bacterium]
MKTSLILTLCILLGTAFVAMWQKSEASTLDTEYQTLRDEISGLGVDPGILAGEQGSLSRMRLNQVLAKVDAIDTKAARDARTRAFAREICEFAVEQKKMERKGPPDLESQARIMRVMENLLELRGDDFKVLLDAFRTDSTLTGDTRQELVGMAVMMLGRQNPQSALDLLAESRQELLTGGRSGFMVGMCLQGLAQKDPAAALAWMEAHRDMVDDQARRQAMQGVAMKDPELAMKTMLDPKDGDKQDIRPIAGGMAASLPDAAARDALLATMRKATQGITPEPDSPESTETGKRAAQLRDGVLGGIGARLTEDSFEKAKTWLESGTLSEEEKARVIDGIAGSLYAKDPAPWLEWMAKNLSGERMSAKLQQIIPAWTSQDFNAVGAWLNGQPAGKTRDEAILSFAETLQPHEPEAAQRWLESLPESPKKQKIMDKLHPPPSEPAAPQPEGTAPEQAAPEAPAGDPPVAAPEPAPVEEQ